MYLKFMQINNFRNIKFSECKLNHKTAIVGKNFTGKTNSLLAIYWLFTDFLLDGSQELPTIKPLDNPSKEVSVKVILDDDTTIEKRYQENWVKTRGSDEVTLQGHLTTFYINGTKQSTINAANEIIKEKLGLDKINFKTTKIDVLKMLINPLYLPEQTDWRTLRNFIIELVKDVNEEDIFNHNKELIPIKELLTKNFFKTDLASKYCFQQIKTIKGEILKITTLIEQLEKIEDINIDELNKINQEILEIDNQIIKLANAKSNQVNPLINELEVKINKLSEQKNSLVDAEQQTYERLNRERLNRISELNQLQTNLVDEVKNQNEQKNTLLQEINTIKNKIQNNGTKVMFNKSRLYDLKNKYLNVDKKQFTNWQLPSVMSCPNCGFIINEDAISKAKELLENERLNYNEKVKSELEDINEEVQKTIIETESLEMESSELRRELILKEKSLFKYSYLEVKNKQIDDINKQIKIINESIKPQQLSDNVNSLLKQISNLKDELESEKKKEYKPDIDNQVAILKSKKDALESIKRKHYIYKDTQQVIKEKKEVLDKYQQEQNEYETKQILINEYIKTKLALLDQNVQAVFNDIKFKLVEDNIKEGSYNEVCYPLILNKDTPFTHGSSSEKIITGVAIIEAIRKHLNLPEIPLLIDGAESLDSETLLKRLETKCQIITTMVDNVNMMPKVISIEGA